MGQDPVPALTRQYKRLRALYLIYLAAAVAALALFFVDRRITLVILAASLIYHLAVVRRCSKRYERAYIHVCGQSTLERRLEQAVHTEAPVLDPEALRQVRLIPANAGRGGVLCREGGSGLYHGRRVRVGDVTFAHSFPMDGKTHHEFVTGAWITVELNRDTGLDWRLIREHTMMESSREHMLQQETDLKRLVGFAPDWIEREWLVIRPAGTPNLPEKPILTALHAAAQHSDKKLAFCIQRDRLHAFVTNRILGQRVSVRLAPMEALLRADYLPELADVLHLSDVLCSAPAKN